MSESQHKKLVIELPLSDAEAKILDAALEQFIAMATSAREQTSNPLLARDITELCHDAWNIRNRLNAERMAASLKQ